MSAAFQDLGLCDDLLRAVSERGYTIPTPIQAQVIPFVLAGRDVMGGAQTGTGKTAAFTLPILERLRIYASASTSPARHPVRTLVLTPTRELAIQVEESVRTYGRFLNLRSAVIYGGVDMDAQIQQLRAGVEIVVATPGRLLDHMGNKTIMLNQVEFLVLDEADRMLDMGFMPDIKRILAVLPRQRQNLLFSATFPPEIKKLADGLLNNPETVEVGGRNIAAENVSHCVYRSSEAEKRRLLARIIRVRELKQVLVFVSTKIGASRLASQLVRDGVQALAIHGDKTQQERVQALTAFKAGEAPVLVATDVAARGLDIVELPTVVNFDLPHSAEDYVHRIGRTGRAGASGEAISLVSPDEERYLHDIERFIGRKIEVADAAGLVAARPAPPPPPPAPSAAIPRPAATPSAGVGVRPIRRSEREIPALLRPPVIRTQ